MKTTLLTLLAALAFGTATSQVKFDPKQVEKVKLVMTKEFSAPYKLTDLKGIDMIKDGKSEIRSVINDLNMMKPVIAGEAPFTQCAVIVVYMKDGSHKIYTGNGKRFNEIVNEKVTNEYFAQTAWNIVEKHWDIKKEVLCE